MKDLAALVGLYTKLDSYLEDERASALLSGNIAGAQRYDAQKRFNDQAYFLVCWGQLEVEIDDACRNLIRSKRSNTRWEVRRGWDVYNPEDKRLSGLTFEDRLSFVLDRDGGRGSPWATTVKYYILRNQIAHGRLQSEAIDVAAVAGDFYTIQAEIQR